MIDKNFLHFSRLSLPVKFSANRREPMLRKAWHAECRKGSGLMTSALKPNSFSAFQPHLRRIELPSCSGNETKTSPRVFQSAVLD